MKPIKIAKLKPKDTIENSIVLNKILVFKTTISNECSKKLERNLPKDVMTAKQLTSSVTENFHRMTEEA